MLGCETTALLVVNNGKKPCATPRMLSDAVSLRRGRGHRFGRARSLLGTRAGPLERPFPRRTPQYVRFEHTPILEPAEPLTIGGDTTAACSVKYYAFGVIVVQLEVPFDCDWQILLSQNSRWMDAADVDKDVREMARRHFEHVARAVTTPDAGLACGNLFRYGDS